MGVNSGKIPFGHTKSKYVKIIITAVIVIVTLVHVISDYQRFEKVQRAIDSADGMFSVHYIDIGQGDATLLRSPSGKFMLIDCGPTSSSGYLVKYLYDMGVERLDYLLITHPHEDHFGGAFSVMEHFEIEELIIHEDFAETYPYDKYIRMADDYGYDVVLTAVGDHFEFGGCAEFEIIGPEKTDADDLNESSLCFRVVYENTAFMFTGDAEDHTESSLLSSGKPLKSNVLKAGHHGSSTSNTVNFVNAVSPEYAVVSCGKNNDYGHPHRETVRIFENAGIKMLRTDEKENIVFVSDGKEVTYLEHFFEYGGAFAYKASADKSSMLDKYLDSWF